MEDLFSKNIKLVRGVTLYSVAIRYQTCDGCWIRVSYQYHTLYTQQIKPQQNINIKAAINILHAHQHSYNKIRIETDEWLNWSSSFWLKHQRRNPKRRCFSFGLVIPFKALDLHS